MRVEDETVSREHARVWVDGEGAVRVTDLVFRTGEREFSILMADASSEAMANVARRVTEALRDPLGNGRPSRVESAFALVPDHASDPGDLLRAARARRRHPLHV